jgi:hypothetical protein
MAADTPGTITFARQPWHGCPQNKIHVAHGGTVTEMIRQLPARRRGANLARPQRYRYARLSATPRLLNPTAKSGRIGLSAG